MGAAQARRMRWVATAASVPAARRFVRDTVEGWGHAALADTSALCTSELVTNAALHSGSSFFEVIVLPWPDGLRVVVSDEEGASASGVVPCDNACEQQRGPDAVPATGLGLRIVSSLAAAWGVQEVPHGKRVWVDLRAGLGVHAPIPAQRQGLDLPVPTSPKDRVVVQLRDCPVRAVLAQESNMRAYLRELQIIGSESRATPLAELIKAILDHNAVSWDAARVVARNVLDAGMEYADLQVAAAPGAAEDVRRLRDALREADRLSDRLQLMTLPAAPEVQDVRDWLVHEYAGQLDENNPPTGYREWAARGTSASGSAVTGEADIAGLPAV